MYNTHSRKEKTFINPTNFPFDGDKVIDLDGQEYEFRNELPHSAGIYLKGHPIAKNFKSWMEFAQWYNNK